MRYTTVGYLKQHDVGHYANNKIRFSNGVITLSEIRNVNEDQITAYFFFFDTINKRMLEHTANAGLPSIPFAFQYQITNERN
jgi:hypothetical protein